MDQLKPLTESCPGQGDYLALEAVAEDLKVRWTRGRKL
jgi:hypothetical protein